MLLTTLHTSLIEFFNTTRYNMGSPLYIRYWDTIHTKMGIHNSSIYIKLSRRPSERPVQKSEGCLEIEIGKINKNPYHTLFFSVKTPEYTNSGYALKFNNIDLYGDFSIEYTESGESLSDKAKIFFNDMIRFIYEKARIKIPEPKIEEKKPDRKKKELSAESIDLDTMFMSSVTAQEVRDAVQSFDPWAGINTTPACPNLVPPQGPFTKEDFKQAAESYDFNLYNDFVNEIIDEKQKIIDFVFFEGFKTKGYINSIQIAYAIYYNPTVIHEIVDYVHEHLPMYGITDFKLDSDKVKVKVDKSKDPREYIKIIDKRWRLIYGEEK